MGYLFNFQVLWVNGFENSGLKSRLLCYFRFQVLLDVQANQPEIS